MKTLFAIGYLLLAICAHAQGPGFNPVRHFAPRPPQCWLDVRQFTEASAADRTVITNQLVDYSGHGFTWGDTSTSKTNVQYLTRLGGCISSFFGGSVLGLTSTIPASNDCQTIMFAGPGSEHQVLKGTQTNQMTIAIRINYRTGSGAIAKTGNQAGRYAYAQFFGSVFWDFGDGDNRISKTIPTDMAGNWVNVFFTRSKTNQDIWMQGPTGTLTNWHTGLKTGLIASGANGSGSPGVFEIFSMGGLTNWYIKRYVFWDYELPPSEMETWSRRMTELP